MADYLRFEFDDGTAVLLQAFPAERLGGLVPAGADGLDLPAGAGALEPVSRVGDALDKAGTSLADALRPLVPVLDSVHRTVLGAARPPDEVRVDLAVKLSGDARLMVIGGHGEASFTVSATWKRSSEPAGPPAPSAQPEHHAQPAQPPHPAHPAPSGHAAV